MNFQEDLARLVLDPELRRFAERRAGSRELAEDALQETYRTVSGTKNPERILNLRAFFRTSLVHEIDHQRARKFPDPVEDIGVTSDLRPGRSWPGRPADSVEHEAGLRLLADQLLARLKRDHDELMAAVPARSCDPRRYRHAIVAAARKILRLLLAGQVTTADWNAVLKSEYPQWCDEPGVPRDSIDQRLMRARRDVQALLQRLFPRGPDGLLDDNGL